MDDIYYKSGGIDASGVLAEMAKIDDELNTEREKNNEEYDREKEFRLLYKQFITGLKLNTGTRLF